VAFDPKRIGYGDLLRIFWESHDPTQGMRQGNDHGTQYRSAIYTHGDAQHAEAIASRDAYARALADAGYAPITTEIAPAPEFFYAEAQRGGRPRSGPPASGRASDGGIVDLPGSAGGNGAGRLYRPGALTIATSQSARAPGGCRSSVTA
jgi:hypothetical protein